MCTAAYATHVECTCACACACNIHLTHVHVHVHPQAELEEGRGGWDEQRRALEKRLAVQKETARTAARRLGGDALQQHATDAAKAREAIEREQIELDFFPERQPFWPFGDPLKEHPEQLQQRERLRVRKARARAEEWMRRNPTIGPQLRSF